MEELPRINWNAKLAPCFDRRDQLRLYTKATSVEAGKRQVRLAREELAREAWRKRKLKQQKP